MNTQHPDGHTPAVERLKKNFEANFLDGDAIQEGQMLSSEECFDAFLHAYSEGIRTSMEVVDERYSKIKEDAKFTHNDDEISMLKKMNINNERAIQRQMIYDLTSTLHDVLKRVESEIISNET